jgi:hypothetical protein
MRIANDTLLTNMPEIITSTWQSEPIWLGHISMYNIQMLYADATAAVIKLQCSSDLGKSQSEKPTSYKVNTWSDIPGSEVTVSGASDGVFEVSEVPYNWVRLHVTGPITLNSVRFNAKGV